MPVATSAETQRTHSDDDPIEPAFRGRLHLLVLLGYLLLTGVMTWPLAAQFTRAIPGDSFDGWQNYWNLWWMKVALVERIQSPLFTDLLYDPTGVGLYFHTLNPFNGLVTLPVQLTAGLIVAYNSVVVLAWVLAGYGVFLLARWLLRGHAPHSQEPSRALWARDAAAFLAGVIYTFAPFHMAHLLGHMQVMSLQWIPFYILMLLRAQTQVRAGRPWLADSLLAGLFLVLTGLCDWYFVLYLFLFTGLAVLWAWLQPGQTAALPARLIRPVLPPLVAGALFLLLLSPLLVPMVSEALRFSFMVRPATDLYILSASLMDFLVPNRLHTLWRPESFTWIGNQIAPVSERTISLGYLPLALALVALWRDRRRALFWVVTGFFFLLLALGPRINLGNIGWEQIPAVGAEPASWTPYGLLNELVPFMRISRSVSRFALMVQLAVAVLAAMGLHVLLTRLPHLGRSRMALVAAGALLLLLAEYWVAPFPMSPPDTPAYYAQLAAAPESPPGERSGALLNLPMNYDRPGYLLYQTVHQHPLTVAYISRDDPRTLTERAPVLQHFRHLGLDVLDVDPAAVGMTVLADLGVTQVVLDRYKMPGGRERAYTEALAGAIFVGHPPLHEDERLTVYAVEPPATAAPYPLLGALHWGPLQNPEGRAMGDHGDVLMGVERILLGEPAALHFHHLPADGQVTLTYRTLPDVPLAVLPPGGDAGAPLLTLPPAPAGQTVTLPVDAWRERVADGPGDRLTLLLHPGAPESVWIQQVGLLLP